MRRIGGVVALAIGLAVFLIGHGAWAGSTAISQPTELDLTAVSCGAQHTHCWFFDLSGKGHGAVVRTSVPLQDQDGNVVGRHRADCTIAAHASGVCTIVDTLHAGASTAEGTITLTGLYDGVPPATFAVTGGTGAYEGVSGYEVFDFDGTNYPTTLFLTP